MEVLKISSKSNPNSVAGAIAGLVKESNKAEMQAIGAGALNQAVKAVAIARGFVAPAGVDLVCIPAFAEVLTVKDFKTTAMQDSRYADLLYTEYTYCRTHLNDIQRKALSVYRIGCNKQHRLNYTCCNFKKLEQYYLDYKIQL